MKATVQEVTVRSWQECCLLSMKTFFTKNFLTTCEIARFDHRVWRVDLGGQGLPISFQSTPAEFQSLRPTKILKNAEAEALAGTIPAYVEVLHNLYRFRRSASCKWRHIVKISRKWFCGFLSADLANGPFKKWAFLTLLTSFPSPSFSLGSCKDNKIDDVLIIVLCSRRGLSQRQQHYKTPYELWTFTISECMECWSPWLMPVYILGNGEELLTITCH